MSVDNTIAGSIALSQTRRDTGRSNATPNPTGNTDSYAGSGNSGISGIRNGDSWQSDPMRHYARGGAG